MPKKHVRKKSVFIAKVHGKMRAFSPNELKNARRRFKKDFKDKAWA